VFRKSVRFALLVAACAAATSVSVVAQADPPTALTGNSGTVIPLKNAAMITKEDTGYRYRSGQQNGHLTITLVDGGLLYTDTGTKELREIPGTCERRSVPVGISAFCTVPSQFNQNNPMFLEVWPRLGDDFTDGSTLPSMFRMWVLADKGDDTTFGGAGDDFVNGAQDNDKASGGAGNDWIRTGIGNDDLSGGDGNDKLVGVEGNDSVRGGAGNDRVGGGPGSDALWGDAGTDVVACGGGADDAYVDSDDKSSECETLTRS